MSKYGNRGVYLDTRNNSLLTSESLNPTGKKGRDNLIYFASLHEYKVFQLLTNLNPYRLHLHQKIELIPPNTVDIYSKGKYWIVDFILETKAGDLIPIEAKGKVMRDFPLILALLELNRPYLYQNLWIVFPKTIPPIFQKKAFVRTKLNQKIVTLKSFQIEFLKQVTLLSCY